MFHQTWEPNIKVILPTMRCANSISSFSCCFAAHFQASHLSPKEGKLHFQDSILDSFVEKEAAKIPFRVAR